MNNFLRQSFQNDLFANPDRYIETLWKVADGRLVVVQSFDTKPELRFTVRVMDTHDTFTVGYMVLGESEFLCDGKEFYAGLRAAGLWL